MDAVAVLGDFTQCFFLSQMVSPMGAGMAESPVYTNLQELKISQSSLPPQPSSSPVHALGDWETHRDASGRHFYFNRATQERTWKPPRARDATSSGHAETPGSAGDVEVQTTLVGLSGGHVLGEAKPSALI